MIFRVENGFFVLDTYGKQGNSGKNAAISHFLVVFSLYFPNFKFKVDNAKQQEYTIKWNIVAAASLEYSIK